MKFIGYAVCFFAVMALSISLRAYTLTTLWGWFIVPGFGVAAISARTAMGLAVIVTSFTEHATQNDKNKPKGFSEWLIHSTVRAVVGNAAALSAGWLYLTIF